MLKYFELPRRKDSIKKATDTVSEFDTEVLPIFNKCQSCHQNNVLNFTRLPCKYRTEVFGWLHSR